MSAIRDDLWVWGKDEMRPRLLHTMLRVRDLDKSLAFYRDALGMKELTRFSNDAGRFTICFISFDDYTTAAIELTHNWDKNDYQQGDAYGHVAIGVPDIAAACARATDGGYEVTLRPKIMVEGGPALAFVRDPDGYLIELIQTNSAIGHFAAPADRAK
ncbi:MAG: lactoylglutathione lyase [Sphingomonadaceae bacterium]